jgi:Putative prokaryotic signal transducing protein
VSDLVRLTIVRTDLDAEMIQSLLKTEGIPAFRQLTDFGAGSTDGFGRGGQHEVLVPEEDLERARELIAER